MCQKCRVTVPFNKQHGKLVRTLFICERQQFYHIYGSLLRQLSLKKSLLVKCKILRLFVNTFTAYDKYSVLNREYLKHPFDMPLSRKEKNFSGFFSEILKFRINFEHIQKQDGTHS